MNTEKKNQHYIPKFYLRNFSYQKNNNQIGVFNLKNDVFYQTSKLKTQGSKNFFYGYDGVIENRLSEIEGNLSQVIKNIINNKVLPKKLSIEHADLLGFVALTDVRNPVKIEGMKNMMTHMQNRVIEMQPDVEIDKLIPKLSHDEIIELSMDNIYSIIMNISDLDYKLIINDTKNPLISSDYPIVKYNQFLENKKWLHSKSGYGVVGLQIFIPLNSEIILHFFDSSIYKVGNKKQKNFIIKNPKCIDEINKLQFVNCLETIYFDEKASEKYIRYLRSESINYKKANESRSEVSYIVNEGENSDDIVKSGQKNLIILGASDCETKLKVDGIKIHSKGKVYKLNSSVTQLRKFPKTLNNN